MLTLSPPTVGDTPQESAKRIKEIAGFPEGVKVVLECTGFESSVTTAIFVRLFPPPFTSPQYNAADPCSPQRLVEKCSSSAWGRTSSWCVALSATWSVHGGLMGWNDLGVPCFADGSSHSCTFPQTRSTCLSNTATPTKYVRLSSLILSFISLMLALPNPLPTLHKQYPKAIRLVAGGLIDLKPLVTHRFRLEEAVKAFHVAADPSSGAIKVQIQD